MNLGLSLGITRIQGGGGLSSPASISDALNNSTGDAWFIDTRQSTGLLDSGGDPVTNGGSIASVVATDGTTTFTPVTGTPTWDQTNKMVNLSDGLALDAGIDSSTTKSLFIVLNTSDTIFKTLATQVNVEFAGAIQDGDTNPADSAATDTSYYINGAKLNSENRDQLHWLIGTGENVVFSIRNINTSESAEWQNGVNLLRWHDGSTVFNFSGKMGCAVLIDDQGDSVADGIEADLAAIYGITLPNPNTALLVHFDGTDAATTVDVEGFAQPSVTFAGNAQIDTAQSVFGGASALFDGTGDVIRFGREAFNWHLTDGGSREFTIELRVRFNGTPATAGFVTNWGGSGDQCFSFAYISGTGLRLAYTTDGDTDVNIATAWSPSADTWYAVAVTRDSSGDLRLFIDGTLQTTVAANVDFFANNNELWVGAQQGSGGAVNGPLNGWIDELRISRTCLYTASYTVATSAFTS